MFHLKLDDINERCRRDPAGFVAQSEQSYTNVIESVAERICENRCERTILLLNGPSSSGKTTTNPGCHRTQGCGIPFHFHGRLLPEPAYL